MLSIWETPAKAIGRASVAITDFIIFVGFRSFSGFWMFFWFSGVFSGFFRIFLLTIVEMLFFAFFYPISVFLYVSLRTDCFMIW